MTDVLVLQKIRNRIIELLDWFSDETKFSSAVTNLEMWADWVQDNNIESFEPPGFTHEEIVVLNSVSLAWENISLESKQSDLEWINFSSKCAEALKVLNKRGLLPEE